MKTCNDCIHNDVCERHCEQQLDEGCYYCRLDVCRYTNAQDCKHFKDAAKFIELPCSIEDTYFTLERFCTEGGYYDEKSQAALSDCEYCCEECDKEYRIVSHKFCSAAHILLKQKGFGTYYFLTKEEAEKKLEDIKNGNY